MEEEIKVVLALITNEHRELIRKKITKTISTMDFNSIVESFIEKEFEYASDNCEVAHVIESSIIDVIREHLVKSGLLKVK